MMKSLGSEILEAVNAAADVRGLFGDDGAFSGDEDAGDSVGGGDPLVEVVPGFFVAVGDADRPLGVLWAEIVDEQRANAADEVAGAQFHGTTWAAATDDVIA